MPAFAIGTGQHLTALHTTEVDVDHPHGVIEGTLNITVSRDGRVTGYFRGTDSPRLIDVDGGIDNGRIWLNIGSEPQINGFYANGEIHGFRSGSRDLVRFTAMPATDQNT